MFHFIYKITNTINSKIYVGQTIKLLSIRFREHCQKSSNCLKLKRAVKKYGTTKFKIELLTLVSTKSVADYFENYFVNKYNSINKGYNITAGGRTPMVGRKHSEKSKIQMSLSRIGKISSSKSRILMSESHKGKKLSKEVKDKISKSGLGRMKGMTWNLVNGKRVWSNR